MTTTTTEYHSVTDDQILELRAEAAQAGDDDQVRLCEIALEDPRHEPLTDGQIEAARAECARVIADAQAQQ